MTNTERANTPTNWPVLDEAYRALRTAVSGVPEDAWSLPTPCARWNVTQVLQHTALDQRAYATAITGAEKGTDDAFAPSGRITEGPLALLDRELAAAAAAWGGIAADAEDVAVPLPPFALPAALAVGACALDAAVHAWDIAVATGRPSSLSPELARTLLPVARAIVTDPLREYGMFAPAIAPHPDADDVAVLVGFLGRRHDWTA